MHLLRRIGSVVAWIGVAFTASLLTGCGAEKPVSSELANHVITIDGDGKPCDPKLNRINQGQYWRHIKAIFAAMDEKRRKPQPMRVIVFVHGGLNTEQLKAADEELALIEKYNTETGANIYPIFVNWDSSLNSSYGEQVFELTQGERDENPFIRGLLSPFYIFADLGRAATRAPLVWATQSASDLQAGSAYANRLFGKDIATDIHTKNAIKVHNLLRSAYENSPGDHVAISKVEKWNISWGKAIEMTVSYGLTTPTKFATSPLIDAAGKAAWMNMSRRTLLMFEGLPGDALAKYTSMRDTKSIDARLGETGRFAGALQDFWGEFLVWNQSRNLPVSLVGHSMGTMILNELIRRNPQGNYDEIIYMAAACSMRRFDVCVMPYLRKNKETQFYNLCLHPVAELRERERAGDLPPRGSLLVWIDNFLDEPQTHMDRTLGRWQNLPYFESIIPRPDDQDACAGRLRSQIHVKVFALREKEKWELMEPQAHGHFRKQPYWDRGFYEPDPPTPKQP